jgi:hypothetical protein
VTYDEAIDKAVGAAIDAEHASTGFEAIDDEHPQFGSFTSYYRDQANMYALQAQAWAAIANALSTRNLEAMEAGL